MLSIYRLNVAAHHAKSQTNKSFLRVYQTQTFTIYQFYLLCHFYTELHCTYPHYYSLLELIGYIWMTYS